MSEAAAPFEDMARELKRTIDEVTVAYASVDAGVSEILTLHLFVERQLDAALAGRLARPEQVARFGFGHKVSLLRALWDHVRIDQIAAALLAFNDIRNAAAHNDIKAQAAARAKLAKQLSDIAAEGGFVAGDRLEVMVVGLLSLLHLALYDAASAPSPTPSPVPSGTGT